MRSPSDWGSNVHSVDWPQKGRRALYKKSLPPPHPFYPPSWETFTSLVGSNVFWFVKWKTFWQQRYLCCSWLTSWANASTSIVYVDAEYHWEAFVEDNDWIGYCSSSSVRTEAAVRADLLCYFRDKKVVFIKCICQAILISAGSLIGSDRTTPAAMAKGKWTSARCWKSSILLFEKIHSFGGPVGVHLPCPTEKLSMRQLDVNSGRWIKLKKSKCIYNYI